MKIRLADYPQIQLEHLIKIPYHALRILVFEILFFFRRSHIMRIYREWYRIHGCASGFQSFVMQTGGVRIKRILKQAGNVGSVQTWTDETGNFNHYETWSQSLAGKHADSEEIRKEHLLSISKNNYPVYCLCSSILTRNTYNVVEYGCGDMLNYGYIKGVLGDKKYIGYDINFAAITRAKKLYPENSNYIVRIASLEELYQGACSMVEPFQGKSIALLSYVLCHLPFEAQQRLLSHCAKKHDLIAIFESLSLAGLKASVQRKAHLDAQRINYIQYCESIGLELAHVLYHPILGSAGLAFQLNQLVDEEEFIRPTNCAMLLVFQPRALSPTQPSH